MPDDASDVSQLRTVLPEVAAASDLLLGPYSTLLMRGAPAPAELRITHGTGRFGRHVADGAEAYARQLGITRLSTGPAAALLSEDTPGNWTLLTAGTFGIAQWFPRAGSTRPRPLWSDSNRLALA